MPPAWEITWAHPALWALRQLHWQDAAKVDAAVQAFASTGKGPVERVRGAPTGVWLKVPPHVVRLSLDAASHTLVVWWLGPAWE